ncbi:RNA-dependent RNA polymerase protein [Thimiri virus]|uniref:RNA-directed RNA polymerase L n=1 Tax=Orthobunyavirus thimiriense TaxID=3052449 RepID=A0A346JEZ5_9VIRU|nr:RNA-dependent RNA polymerase protein [Orthobunyavirus thimiriense]AXP32070.1 RNA-dependent RNA polymerase protein [Orthobunyavirus thimiriense]
MDHDKVDQYRNRIDACRDPERAKEIWRDLLNDRHNYFAREFCDAADWEYRNDVPAEDICSEVLPNAVARNVRFCTPDNYIIEDGKVFIIDFKVAVDDKSSRETRLKYEQIFGEIFTPNGVDFEVVIIRYNPQTGATMIDSDELRRLIPNLQLNIDMSWFMQLKEFLFEKFKDDEKFLAIINQGDFTMTLPWLEEDTPELFTHPKYIEFIESMEEDERQTFIDAVNFQTAKADKWNDNLKGVMEKYKDNYKQFVKTNAQKVFKTTGKYPKPTRDEIDKGWAEMVDRVRKERDVTSDMSKQKPSFHMIWSPNSSESNSNIPKILKLAKKLQSISGTGTYLKAFKSLGKLMDFSNDVAGYERYCSKLKLDARNTSKKIDKKIEEFTAGTCTALWEQQFKLDTQVMDKDDRIHLMKDFFGIGKHKNFSKRMNDDLDLEKPVILDSNDPEVVRKCKSDYSNVEQILGKVSNLEKIGNYLDHYSPKIQASSAEMWDTVFKITRTQFWQCINDYSTLMKNMLAVSQYNRHNTFRVVTCANNNVFGIVMPSSDIKTKKATLVYCVVTIHEKEEDVAHLGSLYGTFRSSNCYVSISKAFRLDKERCQRIVSSPGLFLMTACLFIGDNWTLNLDNLLNFAFHTSVSITKAMLSLTEPSRYMMMNCLALSSHVREYMAEKFSPYTKTAFSVVMTDLIKKGCYSAFNQREKVQLRDVHLTDYDVTQKGVKLERDLKSIWFPGKVNLKEYINQIYMPFYFNSKGLHEKHHVLIDLAKTILEIEKDQRENLPAPWSEEPAKQTVNLKIMIYAIAKNLNLDTARHNFVRSRIENANNLNRSITTISTFTSSKSCIKRGDFSEFKSKIQKKNDKHYKNEIKKLSIANPALAEEITNDAEIRHAVYEDVKKAVPEYIDYMSTKVFDRLYELFKTGEIEDTKTIDIIFKTMKEHKEFVFAFFNKGQKTAKDREIFLGEFEAKLCLYLIERIAKERCKLNPDEMISEPGDSKLKALEKQAEEEIRFLARSIKTVNRELLDRLGSTKWGEEFSIEDLDARARGLKLEINADMSKWSAQDVIYKYFWLFALDPTLYPAEKKRILYFLCNYMEKKLLLPDELLQTILDQRVPRYNDIIGEMTEGYRRNWVNIERNWLQGNMNYTSSYLHSCSMSVFKDIIRECATLLEGDALVNSMVHSDDNQTSICIVQNKLPDDNIIEFITKTFEFICLTFGNQANMKKTYITNFIKEFVSLFNIHGEPFSIYGRFLLTAVGDCAYLGPYEDLASRLSATQTAIKHGCPPSLAWISIALNQWITHTTYNMLPNQINDPLPYFPTNYREEIPIEMCGLLNSELQTVALVGLEAGNLSYLVNLLKRMSPIQYQRESVQSQCTQIKLWDLSLLTKMDIIKLKSLRYISLDNEVSTDDGMGETSDMRSRSLLTPRKFTTSGSLNRLISYQDFQAVLLDENEKERMFEFFVRNPQLLVTKGENAREYMNSVVFRYNSKKFKESLSIQNPAQLFIEQILFSNKPIIDYTSIHDKMFGLQDHPGMEEMDTIIGKKTFPQCYMQILDDLEKFQLTNEDIETVYSFCMLNDPLLITAANNIILSVKGAEQDRLGQSACRMPEMRSLKLIYHSPALVLRAYVANNPNIVGADPDEMQRDLVHLEEFIEKTKLRQHMRERIAINETKLMKRDIQFEVKELTKFYQICYDYVKSTEHKVKIFILPYKVYTPIEFCAALTGNLIGDSKWYITHFLKNIVSTTHKAQISSSPDLEVQLSMECFRLLAHFADMFLINESRIRFLREVVEKFSYKNVPVSHLYTKLRESKHRTKFLPVLFRMGDLQQRDLDKYDADKSDERITWNNWQVSREMNTGPIDLIITGYDRRIRITGEDDRLIAADMQLVRMARENISRHGKAMLNKKHGLKFEKMRRCEDLSDGLDYIVYQQRGRNRYFYNILPKQIIVEHNHQVERTKSISDSKWVPVCPVAVSKLYISGKPDKNKIQRLNMDMYYISKLQINPDEFATIRKAHFQKMSFFTGPPIKSGGIDLSVLMSTPSLLSLNFDTLSQASLVDMCRVFKCEGLREDQWAFEFLSDETMDVDVEEELECNPIFSVVYTTKGDRDMTYKKSFTTALLKECTKFEECFDFLDQGFCSNENLCILEEIHWIVKELKTNQWSTELDQCIHMCMYRNELDAEFHQFDIPKLFLDDPIKRTIKWKKVKKFISVLREHDAKHEPWKSILEHFCEKASRMVNEKIKETSGTSSLSQFVDSTKRGGRSKFEFN